MPATSISEDLVCLRLLRELYEDEDLKSRISSGLSEPYRRAADDWFLRGWPPGQEVKRHIFRVVSWRIGFWRFGKLANDAWEGVFAGTRSLEGEIKALWQGPGELTVLCVWGGEMGRAQDMRLNQGVAPILVRLLVPD
jgi:hypothetical protein